MKGPISATAILIHRKDEPQINPSKTKAPHSLTRIGMISSWHKTPSGYQCEILDGGRWTTDDRRPETEDGGPTADLPPVSGPRSPVLPPTTVHPSE